MKYSNESLSRIEEAWETYQRAKKAKVEKAAAEKAREEFYQEQLAKMTPYKPGARKSLGAIHQRLEGG